MQSVCEAHPQCPARVAVGGRAQVGDDHCRGPSDSPGSKASPCKEAGHKPPRLARLTAEWGTAFQPPPHSELSQGGEGHLPQAFLEEAPFLLQRLAVSPGGDRPGVRGPGPPGASPLGPLLSQRWGQVPSQGPGAPHQAHGFVVCPPECGGQ